jgi:hypothetical protein
MVRVEGAREDIYPVVEAVGMWESRRDFPECGKGGKPASWLSLLPTLFTMNCTVFGYFAALCILSGLLFGIAPALRSSKTNPIDVLKDGAHSVGRHRGGWLTSLSLEFCFQLRSYAHGTGPLLTSPRFDNSIRIADVDPRSDSLSRAYNIVVCCLKLRSCRRRSAVNHVSGLFCHGSARCAHEPGPWRVWSGGLTPMVGVTQITVTKAQRPRAMCG